MHSVQRREASTDGSSKSVEADIGTSNVFSFLGVKIDGSFKKDATKQDDETISETRIHTPTSLFSRLLDYLTTDGRITELSNKESLAEIKNGDFVRFRGNLKQNPLIRTFDSFQNLMALGSVLTDKPQKGSSQPQKQSRDTKQIVAQIKGLSDSLKLGNMVDLLCDIDENVTAVLQSELQFFNNQNIGQIEEGYYTTVGKVIKISKENESISLIRNTSLSIAQNTIMDGFVQLLNGPDFATSGMKIPNLTYEIKNGVLIIPIAIYTWPAHL